MCILITESELKNIIFKSLKKFLHESASQRLFHFCSLSSLERICKTNSISLSDKEFKYNSQGKNFLSLTRNKNTEEGFPWMARQGSGSINLPSIDELCIRIEFDGNALNTYNNFKNKRGNRKNFKIKPFDYLYHQSGEDNDDYQMNGKQDQLSYLSDNEDELYHHPYSQAEDRLMSNAKIIPNANKYIMDIDILIDVNYIKENIEYKNYFIQNLLKLKNIIDKYKSIYTFRLYKDKYSFNYQRNYDIMLINDMIEWMEKYN